MDYSENDEVVQSIRYIRKQRTTKLILAVVALFGILVIGALFVALAYSEEPDAAKNLPAQH
jgi:hypothetical protein